MDFEHPRDVRITVLILLVLIGLAVPILRRRKYGNFYIVGDKKDLRAALKKGRKLVLRLHTYKSRQGSLTSFFLVSLFRFRFTYVTAVHHPSTWYDGRGQVAARKEGVHRP